MTTAEGDQPIASKRASQLTNQFEDQPLIRDGTPDRPVGETKVKFRALDGYELVGTLYAAPGDITPPTVVLLSSGGGVPARRYGRLARYLATQDFPVFSYDYRGIGESRPARMRSFRASNEDWSEYDCSGAIAEIQRRYPDSELVAIAHSFGTFLVGGALNVSCVSRFVFIGAHTGYLGDYRRAYRLPMTAMWHGVMPVLARLVGYFPGRALRLGEDIPQQVARQWATRWTPEFRPENSFDVARARAWIDRHRKVTGCALVIGVADDAFSTESGTRRLLEIYPALRVVRERVAPGDIGLERMGHFGYFWRQAETALWPRIVAFLRNERDT